MTTPQHAALPDFVTAIDYADNPSDTTTNRIDVRVPIGTRLALQAKPAVAPTEHIKEPYTLAELNALIASNDYSAELLLQHAMLLLNAQPAAPLRLDQIDLEPLKTELSDPAKARAFLQKHGFLTETGELAEQYGGKQAQQAEVSDAMNEALKALDAVAAWQLPQVPDRRSEDPSATVPYGVAYGSNGERDYMRSLAQTAAKRARAILALRPQADHPDTARCIKARNDLNAALHGEGALIDDLEHAVANACAKLKRRRSFAGDRADFEGWMSEGGKWPKAVERGQNGDYLLLQTATNWSTWQACASLRPQAVPMTENQRADMACAVAAICTGASSRTVADTAIGWAERFYGITQRADGGEVE